MIHSKQIQPRKYKIVFIKIPFIYIYISCNSNCGRNVPRCQLRTKISQRQLRINLRVSRLFKTLYIIFIKIFLKNIIQMKLNRKKSNGIYLMR